MQNQRLSGWTCSRLIATTAYTRSSSLPSPLLPDLQMADIAEDTFSTSAIPLTTSLSKWPWLPVSLAMVPSRSDYMPTRQRRKKGIDTGSGWRTMWQTTIVKQSGRGQVRQTACQTSLIYLARLMDAQNCWSSMPSSSLLVESRSL